MESKWNFNCFGILANVTGGKRRVRGLFIELVCFFAFANVVAGGNVSHSSTFVIITLIPKMRWNTFAQECYNNKTKYNSVKISFLKKKEESQCFIFKHFPALFFPTCEEAQVPRFWSLKILGIKSKLFILQLKKNLKIKFVQANWGRVRTTTEIDSLGKLVKVLVTLRKMHRETQHYINYNATPPPPIHELSWVPRLRAPEQDFRCLNYTTLYY